MYSFEYPIFRYVQDRITSKFKRILTILLRSTESKVLKSKISLIARVLKTNEEQLIVYSLLSDSSFVSNL